MIEGWDHTNELATTTTKDVFGLHSWFNSFFKLGWKSFLVSFFSFLGVMNEEYYGIPMTLLPW